MLQTEASEIGDQYWRCANNYVYPPIDRIAARSLAFNLMYLLTRMERGG